MNSRAISLPFSFNSGGGISYTDDEGKMWQDRVVAVIMTNFNERVMMPNFGSDAPKAAFYNQSEAGALIEAAAKAAFAQWLPALEFEKSEVKSIEEDVLTVEITYKRAELEAETVTIKTDILTTSGDLIQEVPRIGR